jgi:hypothetical protein
MAEYLGDPYSLPLFPEYLIETLRAKVEILKKSKNTQE